jgi:hypothetical protein
MEVAGSLQTIARRGAGDDNGFHDDVLSLFDIAFLVDPSRTIYD